MKTQIQKKKTRAFVSLLSFCKTQILLPSELRSFPPSSFTLLTFGGCDCMGPYL